MARKRKNHRFLKFSGKIIKVFIIIAFISFVFLNYAGNKLEFLKVQNTLKDYDQQIITLRNEISDLRQENDKYRQFSLAFCHDNNKFREYVGQEPTDCSVFIDPDENEGKEINIASELIASIDIFVIKGEKTEDLRSNIIKSDHPDENKNQELTLDEIKLITDDENLHKYLDDLNLSLEKRSDKLLRLKKNDTAIANIFWNEKEKDIQIHYFDAWKVISLSNFPDIVQKAKKEIKNENDFDLQAFMENAKKINDNSKNQFSFLILGKHGGNVDTMMLTTLDHDKKTITMISIPRDLWVQGCNKPSKINAIRAYCGIDHLMKLVGDLTGQEVSNYILIDMYAFIDVINELGGIDYQFEKPLIDPTYKTVDNGVEGTLYFPAGDKHLNGVQALRVARTRHTSSDFARADRQQKILKSIKNKVDEIGKTKALVKIVEPLMENVNTDFTLYEILPLLVKTRGYDIRTGNVISTGNILTSKMYGANCPEKDPDNPEEETKCKKAYILEPKNGDWNLIKQYVLTAIND